ncbi:membrane protein insertase YidC [Bacteroidia bacterium]|nr:membrane protein insertase YidC [Bacteroidia bacterium]
MVKYLDNSVSGFNQFSAKKESEKKGGLSKLLWWAAIFLLSWWAFSYWFGGDKTAVQPTAAAVELTTVGADMSSVPVWGLKDQKISANAAGLRIYDISLADYKQDKDGDEPVRLLAGDGDFIEIGFIAAGTVAPNNMTKWKRTSLNNDNGPTVEKLDWRNADGIEFTRSITIENYIITVSDEIKNNSPRDVSFTPYALVVRGRGSDSAGVASGAIVFAKSDIERDSWGGIEKSKSEGIEYKTESGFAAFEDQYWETVAQMSAPLQVMRFAMSGEKFNLKTTAAPVNLSAGASKSFVAKIFAGPKLASDLKSAASQIPGLDNTINYGFFWFLSMPFLWALNALFGIVGNYGVAIIILTIILRVLMWPLTKKSYTNMAKMQEMQPEMQRIQKLYKDDKVRLQQEMMKLYALHKTSPVSGCLPMLLQIPIFFALYKALLISAQMRHTGFLWIHDLAVADPTSIFNLFGLLPWAAPSMLQIGILPILMGLTMWYQQKLSSSAMQTNNAVPGMATVMKWMPVLFVVMLYWMPAGLVLYWTISNIFGIVQMRIIKKS